MLANYVCSAATRSLIITVEPPNKGPATLSFVGRFSSPRRFSLSSKVNLKTLSQGCVGSLGSRRFSMVSWSNFLRWKYRHLPSITSIAPTGFDHPKTRMANIQPLNLCKKCITVFGLAGLSGACPSLTINLPARVGREFDPGRKYMRRYIFSPYIHTSVLLPPPSFSLVTGMRC